MCRGTASAISFSHHGHSNYALKTSSSVQFFSAIFSFSFFACALSTLSLVCYVCFSISFFVLFYSVGVFVFFFFFSSAGNSNRTKTSITERAYAIYIYTMKREVTLAAATATAHNFEENWKHNKALCWNFSRLFLSLLPRKWASHAPICSLIFILIFFFRLLYCLLIHFCSDHEMCMRRMKNARTRTAATRKRQMTATKRNESKINIHLHSANGTSIYRKVKCARNEKKRKKKNRRAFAFEAQKSSCRGVLAEILGKRSARHQTHKKKCSHNSRKIISVSRARQRWHKKCAFFFGCCTRFYSCCPFIFKQCRRQWQHQMMTANKTKSKPSQTITY